jgi:signal transduction histidine kinase
VAGKLQAVRAASDTALPWTLRVSSASPSDDFAQLAGRRRLLLAGLAVTAFLVLVSSYLITRALVRELAVARLQSDFVSAVSHEFRSPLTSMCHLTEMLADGDEPGAERRRQYYQVLAGETRRLHRLVEGLLNFGRMEAGAHEYRFEPLDPAELVREVVAEFQAHMADGHQIEVKWHRLPACVAPAGSADASAHRLEHRLEACATVRADREALSRALWNLLDNAVKYSPDCPTVWVEVGSEAGAVTIRVRDQGVGIPAAERKRIFHKFVRGGSTKTSGVKGTGIGLTMAQHIVRAHGGHLRVESEPGRGSTFTIVLPGVTSDK